MPAGQEDFDRTRDRRRRSGEGGASASARVEKTERELQAGFRIVHRVFSVQRRLPLDARKSPRRADSCSELELAHPLARHALTPCALASEANMRSTRRVRSRSKLVTSRAACSSTGSPTTTILGGGSFESRSDAAWATPASSCASTPERRARGSGAVASMPEVYESCLRRI